MNRKINALCAVIVAFSLVFTIAVSKDYKTSKSNLSTANIAECAESESAETSAAAASTTDILGFLEGLDNGVDMTKEIAKYSEQADGIFGMITDIAGNIGSGKYSLDLGSLASGLSGAMSGGSGLLGGLGGGSGTSAGTTASGSGSVTYSYITPVGAATSSSYSGSADTSSFVGDGEEDTLASTISEAPAVTDISNPYAKPKNEIKPEDEGDDVRWVQWILSYIGYCGFNEAGINGKYDSDTLYLIKRIQEQNGVEPDGIISVEFLDYLENLYFQKKFGGETTAEAETQPTAAQTVPVTEPVEETGGTGMKILIIALSAVFILVIAAAALLFILKRKKKKAKAEEPTIAAMEGEPIKTMAETDIGKNADKENEADKADETADGDASDKE